MKTKFDLLCMGVVVLFAQVIVIAGIFFGFMFLLPYTDALKSFGVWVLFGMIPSFGISYLLLLCYRGYITYILDSNRCIDYHDPDLPYDPDPDYDIDTKDKIVLGVKAMTD